MMRLFRLPETKSEKDLILYRPTKLNKLVKSRDNTGKKRVKKFSTFFFSLCGFYFYFLTWHEKNAYLTNRLQSLATRHRTRWTVFFFPPMRSTLESLNLVLVSKLGGVFRFVQNPFKSELRRTLLRVACSFFFFFCLAATTPNLWFQAIN